ncbi:MAG: AsmA-like C-terminal domain-containing protein [Pirellulales bacterium]|nr:AsmA-like C-terminal domain-containing protein [Pirellulales bacterium]
MTRERVDALNVQILASGLVHVAAVDPSSLLPMRFRAIAGLFKVCWFGCKWGVLLTVVVVAAAGFYISTRIHNDIRRHVEKTLAEHYEPLGLEVSVEGARRIEGEGIRVTGIAISDPSLKAKHAELARIDELFLVTDADLLSLVQGKATAREIIIRTPTLRTTVNAANQWSASKLLPLPKFGEESVPVRVEHARVEIHETDDTERSPWKVRDISFRFARRVARPDAAAATLASSQPPPTDSRHIEGTLVCQHFGNVEFDGTYDSISGDWQLKGGAADVRLSREMVDSLPRHVATKVELLSQVRCNMQLTFAASKSDAVLGFDFNARAELKNGQLTDPRLPFPLGDLRATVVVANHGVTIENLTARHGQTSLELTGEVSGLTAKSPAVFTAKVRRLSLDRKMALVGTPLEKLWHDFQPSGVVDIDSRFTFDGHRWTPDAHVTCHDVGFTFRRFPYPLEGTKGTLHLIGKSTTMQLVALSGGQPVQIRGQLHNLGPQATGWVEFHSTRLPVDQKLVRALPPAGAEMVRRLRATGYFDVAARIWRDDPRELFHQQCKICLKQCAVRFDRFPYPLRNVTGKIDMIDGHWTFYDLESVDSRRHVTGWGSKQRPSEGGQLLLHFIATDVPLDDQLHSSLDESLKELWDQLNPRGTIDKIKVGIRHLPGRPSADLIVRLENDARGGLRRIDGSSRMSTPSISIKPEFFRYKFDKVGGVATYTSANRRVSFDSLRAEHKDTRLTSGGYVDVGTNGGWTFRMLDASVDRLRVDHDLKLALPDGLRDALADLNPTGQLNLRGDFQLSQPRAGAALSAAWNLKANALRTDLSCGDLLLENVSGSAHFLGNSQGDKFQSRAELALDAATYEDFHFTDIRGPMWLTNNQVLIGSVVPRSSADEKPRNLTAKTYGGSVAADGRVAFGRVPTWSVQASLSNADLRRFANDKLPGKQNIEGKAFGEVSLAGTSQGLHTMNGQGKFRIRNGKMYDLPLMLAMLKLLRVREPSTTAFNRADVDFKVRGKYVHLNHIDFKGDAISLFGNGEMNLDGDVRMKLSAVLGREDFDLPLVRQLVTSFNQQIMTIHVDGTIDDPKVTNEPFPVINRAIETIQGDPEPTPANASWSRRTRDYLRRSVPWPN